MTPSQTTLDILVEKLFDYAGMFPPAKLDFVDALKTSAGFPTSLTRPELVAGDIVLQLGLIKDVTTSSLQELGFSQGRTCQICVLGGTLEDPAETLQELQELAEFRVERMSEAIPQEIISYEVKLGEDLQKDATALKNALYKLQIALADLDITAFIEPDLSIDNWASVAETVCTVLAELNNNEHEVPSFALKIRGTGPTAIGNEKLAKAVKLVCKYKLPFKATAGLHHPIIESERYNNNLGFINLLTALHLERVHGNISESELLSCLEASNSADFKFDSESLTWGQHSISREQLVAARKDFHFSIGSCSLHEPDEDLQRLF